MSARKPVSDAEQEAQAAAMPVRKPRGASQPAPAPDPPPAPPRPRPEPICGNCLAWKQVGERIGECRMDPPKLAANGSGQWPTTRGEDWCLQWADAEPPQ